MAICDTCGNHYEKSFTVTFSDGRTATFDSVECAAVQLAPECAHCGAGFWDMTWRHPRHLLLRPLRAQGHQR